MLDKDTHNRRERRRCLKCNRSFLSKHRFNRLCDNCSKQNATVNWGEYVLHPGGASRRALDDWG
jgi:Zn finger protein HypA/HybF involved in hydrogenase expression